MPPNVGVEAVAISCGNDRPTVVAFTLETVI